MKNIEEAVRTIMDFPKPGIAFKDISPLLSDPDCFHQVIGHFAKRHAGNRVNMVIGIEARGFVFASALAYALRAGTAMIRKPGKLPFSTYRQAYDLEYGTDSIEIHTDAFRPGQRILVFDDVLATGGTVAAAAHLIEENFNVEIVEFNFLMALDALNGQTRLDPRPVYSLLHY
ncbi:MAG: adenine phosphoribosyltransferase [Pontiellaceae bacterium]|nr:adenine phosphoribosyltransferase [Pontiellaceae bacterium]MBN2783874.1 adenine phosphoribosyltransferase [Pontiellaceae bacterium]